MKNNFIGGMSSKLTPFDVAKKWKISPVEFIPILEKGTEHEMEHTDDKDIARRIALDHIVERLDYYDQLDKIEKMKKGAVLEKPEIFNDITLYYEKKGNWLFDKGNFYAWLYDEKGAGAKLEKQEYDFIMFPPMGKGSPFSDKYVPPLKMIWDKTYQKKFKGINHLLGIVKGFYDEDKNQIIIEMMTTNPKFRRQGINAHIIKNLREVFEVSQDDVIFDKPTKEGKLFESSKKYENGGLIAPNGEQSNLTPELYQVVRTKAFKNWFGDWENDPENASKVLDKNGEPKIVYHGTNNDFTIFDKNKLGEKNFFAESASLGFFFAGNIKTSEAYIGMNSMDWAGVQFGAYDDIINKYKPELDSINKDIQQIYEKYRKQEKDNIKKLQDEIIEKIRETYKDFSENDSKGIFLRDINWEEINRLAQEENNLNGNTQKLKELNDKIKSEIEAKWKVKTNANPRIISLFLNIRNPYIIDYANNKQTDLSQDIKTAIKNTNDGVIFNNLNDGDGVDDIFVVFDSEQIKLADGTNTTFDRNNPDIRFAKGGDTNRNFNDKELLKRYNDGESIGFTAIAHLKAQGLIKRSDGTKRKSKGIFKQGGLIAPNGEQSNLTSEQWDLVRTPEFKGWFGFWDLYPSGKANDYYEPSVRTIAKELKQEKASAIKEVVDFLSKQVTEEDVLIPMPSRFGFATDTQKLAEKISEKTGAKVFDCLVGKKRESIYELKKTNQDVSEFEFDFQINCEIPKARNYFIVDNVIGTGTTMKNALMNVIARVGKNVSPLVYAIDLNNISKVVDENDEPLVVHHGSIIDTKFDIFDYKKADLGFHFGTKEQAKKRVESKSVLPPRKSIVNSFFLNIKVLFEMTDVGEWQYPQRYIDELMSDNIIEEKVAKQKGFLSLYRREDNAIIRDYIKSKYGSFVGFVYNNKYEGNGKSFIALSPEQIKLADGTNTTFDENNPDIRFAKGGLIAPNGNESNLTPEQYKLVRTKAFKDWFGDWENDPENSSKVVDENGEPLVVYHGTKYTEEFYQFDLEAISDENVKAFFFSKGYEHAKRYTFSTGSVKAFFLKAIKLFDPKSLSMSESKKIRSILNESVVEDFIEYNYLDGLEEWKSKYDSNMSDEDFLFYILTNTDSSWGVVELQVFQDYLKSKNYDGFITYEQVTNESIPNINYAVFESNQIKLADGMNTTFDGNNPDIRFAKGGLIAPNGNESNLTPEQYKLVRTKAFKNWFGDWENDPENSSKVVDDNGEPLVMYHGTAFGEFNEFDLNRIGRNYEQSFGFYFTNIKNKNTGYSAQEYANRKFISKKPYVFEVFLNIKNPILQEVFSERPAQAIDWERNQLKAELRKGLKDGVIAESRWQKIKEVIAVTLNSEQIKLADGSNTTFDSGNPDIRFNKGGEIENLIDQGEIELKVYPTTPEHANVYGLNSENPLYIESIFISENQRLKGLGKKVLEYLNDFAIKNGHDVMFGHITQKASFSKDDSRQSDLDDVDMIKYWLQSNGYETCEGNNDFYKVMNKPNIIFEDGGVNLSNKELMANDFLNEQKELQRNSKYAIFLDTNYSNYTNEKRELLKNLTDELIKKLGYNPLINYYLTSDKVILMFDDDSNLIGALEFTIQPKYTDVPRYSPDYIKPEPIFENNDNVFYIEYIFSFSKGNGQKMMNRIKKYADQYNVDIGLEGSIIEGTDGKPIASAKHLRRFYDKQGFINVKGHYFLYTPNSMEKGGEVTTENKIYEITRHYFGSLNASSVGGYFNVDGVSLRIKNHLANWNNFYEYHLKNIDENSNPYFLSVVIGSENSYKEQDKADINTEEFVNDNIEENTNLKAEEIVFDYSDTIEDIIYTIDKKMKKMTSMAKGGKTISQTPAPASDRVSGSKTNPKGSASDTSLARSIKFNDSLLKAIENKVKAHNEEYPSKKVTKPTAKAVVRRGMGAYSKSHRPFITGGAPNSRQAWGLARLNKFLLKKRGVKVKSAYIQDDDLL